MIGALGFHIPIGPWCENANERIAELEVELATYKALVENMSGEIERVTYELENVTRRRLS